jgi:anaphase-promoting complex subunit 11
MKVIVKQWHAIAQWQWDTGKNDENGDPEEDVCGICRVPFEGCCPTCRVPGDDCPLSRSLMPSHLPAVADDSPTFQVWGECSHVFHMHCLLKWVATAASKQQCPMDRRVWGAISLSLLTYCSWTHGTHIYPVTAERKISTSDS